MINSNVSNPLNYQSTNLFNQMMNTVTSTVESGFISQKTPNFTINTGNFNNQGNSIQPVFNIIDQSQSNNSATSGYEKDHTKGVEIQTSQTAPDVVRFLSSQALSNTDDYEQNNQEDLITKKAIVDISKVTGKHDERHASQIRNNKSLYYMPKVPLFSYPVQTYTPIGCQEPIVI
jgi:hypothetical protein